MEQANGDDGRVRTLDPQSRNLVLYPAELRHHLKKIVPRINKQFPECLLTLVNILFFNELL